jgi:glycosyltransferase involved in cell wall biosynthesis
MIDRKLSVIIPTYNRPELIINSVRSVLNQTFSNLELIVVDGSDTDETSKQISSINDDRLKYVKIKNESAAHSRNIGLELAIGDFVAFNDDDDEWDSDKAEKQLLLLSSNKSLKVIYSAFSKEIRGHLRITPDEEIIYKSGRIYNELLLRNFVGLPTIVVARSCCQEVMFDEKLRCLEDWDWIIRLAARYTFGLIGESLVKVNNTPTSVNKSSYSIKAEAYKRIYYKYIEDIIKSSNINAKHLLSIGNNLCLAGEMEAGRGYLIKSLRTGRKRSFAFAALLLSYLGWMPYVGVFKFYEKLTCTEP